MQSGAIDATEWVGPYNDLAFGLYKLAKHYHYPGFHEPGATLSLGVRRALWDKMSKGDQAIMQACALAENNVMLAEFNANNASALETLQTKHGVQLHEFSDAIFKAAAAAARDILAKAAAADPLTGKIYASFSAFKKQVAGWSRISDQAYLNKRFAAEN
jgi:TRAP-type mannitol/chloroaromatic compound transport system substrate-binding protein